MMRSMRLQSAGASSSSRPTALGEEVTSSSPRPTALGGHPTSALLRPTNRSEGPVVTPSQGPRMRGSSTASREEVRGGELEQAEPQEELPNRADGHHVITLTGRRRRFRSEPIWEAWFAESGQCFHRREDCRGLRNANRKQAKSICGVCQRATQQQRPYGRTTYLYEDQLMNLHTDSRCEAVTGVMMEIRQCKVCGV